MSYEMEEKSREKSTLKWSMILYCNISVNRAPWMLINCDLHCEMLMLCQCQVCEKSLTHHVESKAAWLTCCHYITQSPDSKHQLDRLPRLVCFWTCEWRVCELVYVCTYACTVCGCCDLGSLTKLLGSQCVCVCHRVVSAALIAVYLVCGLTQSFTVRSTTDSSVFIGSLWTHQH